MQIKNDLSNNILYTEQVEKEFKNYLGTTQDIIDNMSSCANKRLKQEERDQKLFQIITQNKVGDFSVDFTNYLKKKNNEDIFPSKIEEMLDLYLGICDYLRSQENKDLLKKMLEKISKIKQETSISPSKILEKNFLKMIYTSGNKEITDLFKDHGLIPPYEIFDQNNVPNFIQDKENAKVGFISKFMEENADDLSLESKVMYIQRNIRSYLRQKNEQDRIRKMYFASETEEIGNNMAINAIKNANIPYRPKCEKELSIRIIKAAQTIKLYSSVSHLASADNIASILDDVLYGRENLLKLYKSFRPAALMECDFQDGDFNVICFGPDKIDTKCLKGKTIQLEFDRNKITNGYGLNKNPNIFFKQTDFGYGDEEKYKVKLKTDDYKQDKVLIFNHTSYLGCCRRMKVDCNNIHLHIYDQESDTKSICCFSLPKYHFISYNIENMDQIFILNFFKLLDSFEYRAHEKAGKSIAEIIYKQISLLTGVGLTEFLADLGRKMSCTSEFNFSGGYKIDLDALIGLRIYNSKEEKHRFNINELCAELNDNNFKIFDLLMEEAPTLFESTRFNNHIRSKLTNEDAISKFNNKPSNNTSNKLSF